MSKLLNLAKQFEEDSKKEAELMTETVKAVIKEHECVLRTQLMHASHSLSKSIEEEKAKLISRTIAAWRLPAILLAILVVCLGVILVVIMYLAASEYREMNDWKASAEIYKKQSHQVLLSHCIMDDKTERLCVKIDPKYQDQNWGDKQIMKII